MKGSRLFLVAALALASSSSLPSFATHPNIEQHYYRARPQVQVIDNSPLVTNHVVPPSTPQTYVIEAPMATQPAAPPVVIGPSANPQMLQVLPNTLPPAGFQSAITAANHPRMMNLPNGNSTNMLAGRMLSAPKTPTKPAPTGASAAPAKPSLISSAPRTMVYADEPSAIAGSQNRTVVTAVKGNMQRGALLTGAH